MSPPVPVPVPVPVPLLPPLPPLPFVVVVVLVMFSSCDDLFRLVLRNNVDAVVVSVGGVVLDDDDGFVVGSIIPHADVVDVDDIRIGVAGTAMITCLH
jgi:hypothetical protein